MSFSIGTNRNFHLPMISAKRYLLPYNYLVFLGTSCHPLKCNKSHMTYWQNVLNISEKYAQPERQIKCHDRRPFSATPASGARRSGGCPGRTCPRAHLSAPPPASNSESGLPVPVLHQRPASRQVQPSIPADISLQKNQKKDLKDSVSRTGLKRENWRIGSIQICSF